MAAGDQFVRFGAKTFSREDILNLQATTKTAPLLEAFRHRFPVGSSVLAAPVNEAPVTLCKVLTNDGHTFRVQLEDENSTATLSLKKDLFLFQQLLFSNLPLINNRSLAPAAQWRALFEKHVDQAEHAMSLRKERAIPLNKVDTPDTIANPCGFNIFGQLFMMVNPTYRADELSRVPSFTGHINDPLGMAEAVLPVTEVAAARAEAQPDVPPDKPLQDLVNEHTFIVNPEQLLSIIGEGMYERAAFVMRPPTTK